jgi:hypothetical protein
MTQEKITYGREEGGFAVYVNGRKTAVFRVKGWMNNLRETPERTVGQGRPNYFLKTQYEYHGKYE